MRLNIDTIQIQSGRQNAWIFPWVKRAKRLRIVSVPGKRLIPNIACRALSERNQSVCAKRLAPTTTENKNAINVCAGGMALGLRSWNGIAF